MTFKQKTFIKRYIENAGNGTRAALEVYDTNDPNVAAVISSENLRKPNIQQAIHQALEAEGLTPRSSIKYLKEAMLSGLGQKATNSDTLRGLDMLYKLQGAYNQPVIEETYKMKLEKMSNKELEIEVERVRKETAQILEDVREI